MPRMLCSHHGMWAGACIKPFWVLESSTRCSVQCSKGAAARDDLAGDEVSRCLINVLHGEVREVLLVRKAQLRNPRSP
jgi:hypothetical protein